MELSELIDNEKNYDSKDDNEFISLSVVKVSKTQNLMPTVTIKVLNKTNQQINIRFSDTYYITHDRIQHDIRVSDYYKNINILPRVSKTIICNLTFLAGSDFVFFDGDLVINSFYINDNKYYIGHKISDKINKKKTEPILPIDPNKGKVPAIVIFAYIIVLIFIIVVPIYYVLKKIG